MRTVVFRLLAAVIIGIALVQLPTGSAAPLPPPQAKGVIKSPQGQSVGNIGFTQARSGIVFVSATIKGLPPGTHTISIRERGSCSPDFAVAGPPRPVNLPPVTVRADGTAPYEASTRGVTVTSGPATLLDNDGTAVLILANGDEGTKIGCAVLEPVAIPAPLLNTVDVAQVQAEFKTEFGATVGTTTVTQRSDGTVLVQAQVRGLPPGPHAIHFHQFGQCTPTFGAAGEHHNPFRTSHGLRNPSGPHAGDLPQMTVGSDGIGNYEATTSLITLTPSPVTILDTDGTTLMIHTFGDDQVTDPGGNSNGRIACAVIQPNLTGR